MLTAITTIGMNVSNTLSKVATLGRRKAIVAAAVAATSLLTASHASAFMDATSVSTTLLPGIGTTVNNVSGAGSAQTGFTSNKSYNIVYAGQDLRVDSVQTSTSTFIPTGSATAVVRRFSGPNTDILWYKGTGTSNSPTLNLQAGAVNNFNEAFSGNNLLVGTDNLFANTGNGAGNNTNVERLDMLYNAGFTADSSKAFTVFDRGFSTQHDGFKIAAITSLDGNNVPNGYGNLLTFNLGTWGKTALTATENYIVVRRNNDVAGDQYHPSDEVQQSLGAVVVPTSDLAATGTRIFGYSIFALDTNGSGNNLVNWTDPTYFPTGTSATGTTATTDQGGLDAIGTLGVLYTTAVPEPATGSIMLAALGGLLARRTKRNKA